MLSISSEWKHILGHIPIMLEMLCSLLVDVSLLGLNCSVSITPEWSTSLAPEIPEIG